MTPDDSIRELARKTARSIVDHGSVPMATLKESIILQEKVDTLLNKPDVVIPEYPEIPEVDLSPIEEKIDEILAETKKKDSLEYDLQIDEATRAKLKGEKGDTGKSGKNGSNGIDGKDGINGIDGKDGVEISPEEVVSKLESLKDEKRLSVKAIKGLDEIIKNVKETRVASGGVRLLTNLYDVVIASPTDGQGLVYDATTEKWINRTISGSISETFESVLRNLKSYPTEFTYNVDNQVDTVVYTLPSGSITETINYTGTLISSIVLSGSTPSGVSLTKSFSYSGNYPMSIAYS